MKTKKSGPYKLSEVIAFFEELEISFAYRKCAGVPGNVYLVNVSDEEEEIRLIKTHDLANPLKREKQLVGQNFGNNDFDIDWFIERSV